jgi:NDP-sugar pyrophosphorylase family protein
MKERISLTVDKELIKRVDQRIDGSRIKNRSHAVETLLLKALGEGKLRKAFILAGGKGTRLRPITHEIPKPMILINGRPILEYSIDMLKRYDVRDIMISVGYKGEKIKEYFGDGSKFGVKITYVEEKEPLGTGGPLRLVKHFLNETFVMMNADELKDIDLHDMYAFHKAQGGLATIALTTVNDPSMYGVAKLNGNKIVQFVEKPKPGEAPSNLINAGLYILEPQVVDMVPNRLGEVKIETEVFPKIAKMGKLFGYPFSGYWSDLGTLERYEKALNDLKGGMARLSYLA